MTRPTEFPDWATDLVTEVVIVDGNAVSYDNKVATTSEWQTSGELHQQNLPRQYVNYDLNLLGLWVRHFEERAGSVYSTVDAGVTTGTLATSLGGTWVQAGVTVTTGTGATTIYHFNRTSL